MRWVALFSLIGCGRIAFDARSDALAVDMLTVDTPAGVGLLDPSFGDGGIATPVGTGNQEPRDIAYRANGYVVAGVELTGTPDLDVFALDDSGNVDTSFASNGFFVGGPTLSTFGYGMAVLPDERILVTGDTYGLTDDAFFALFSPDGVLDPSFSSDGFGEYDLAPTMPVNDTTRRIALGGSRFAVGCGVANYDGDTRFALVAITASGALDPQFSGDGIVDTNFTTGSDECFDILVDGNTYVAVGRINAQKFIARFSDTGVIMGSGSIGQNAFGRGVAKTAGNEFVIAGAIGVLGSVTKVGPTFGVDLGFGTNGTFSAFDDNYFDVALQADGKIIVVGLRAAPLPVDETAIILRLLPDGTLDPSFGTNGVVLPVPDKTSTLRTVTIDPAGRIVAAGWYFSGTDARPLIVRLL